MRGLIRTVGAALAFCALAGTASAQRIGGTSGGGTTGGSGSGGSGGFIGGGSGGSGGSGGFIGGGFGSGGSTGGSGGFIGGGGNTGGSGGFIGGGGTGGAGGGGLGRTGGGTYNSNSPFASYMGNPLAPGLRTGTANNTSAIGQGSNTVKPYPTTLSFGQPLYNTQNTATTTRTGNQGTLGGGIGGIGGMGGQGQGIGTAGVFNGASSVGIPRAPSFTTHLAFERNAPRPAVAIHSDVRAAVAGASRLPSRDRIRVTMDEGVIRLSGNVKNDRERRLAEAIVRMSPGVRDVQNDLVTDEKAP